MTEWALVGREEELQFVTAALAAPACRGVVLGGVAGVGKSRLAAEALAVQQASGVITETARATRAASSVPFGALAHLLPPAAEEVWPNDRLAVLHHLVSSIAARAVDGSLVLAVDDAHLLDDGAATVVHQLAATGAARLVLTVRTGERVPDSIEALWKDSLCERLELQLLSRLDVGELLEAVLGGPVESGTLARLWDLSQGNALFLRQMVSDALDEGGLTFTRGAWTWSGTAAGPRLAALVKAQVDRLDEMSARAVRLLALGEPLPVADLAALTDTVSVDSLERHGIVVVEPGPRGTEARLSHPLFGEVVRPLIPAATTVELVRDLASLILGDFDAGAVPAVDAMRLGCWSLDHGLRTPPGLLARSTAAALTLGEWVLAERLARAAIAEGDTSAVGQLGWSLYLQLRHEEAEEVLAQIDLLGRERDDLIDLVRARTFVLHLGLGRTAAAGAFIEDTIELIGDDWVRDDLRGFWAMLLMLDGRLDEAGPIAIPLMQSPNVRVRLRALSAASTTLTFAGRAQEVIDLTDELIGPALELQSEIDLAPLWVGGARITALLVAGHLDALEQFLDLVEAFGDTGNFSENNALLDIVRGRLALMRGQPVTAARHLAGAASLLDTSNVTGRQAWALGLLAEAHALVGDADAAAAAWTEIAKVGGRTSALYDTEVERAGAWVLAARGDMGGACRAALDAADEARARGSFANELMVAHDALRLGSRDGVADRIIELADVVSGAWAPAFAAHTQAMLDDDGAALDAVADQFETMGARLLAAEAATQAARVHAREGLLARSSTSTARATGLLAACEGASTPILAERRSLAKLTPREREIATLAADGGTSRAIAEQLYVSVRTIDNQLQSVYRKLGVHGRAELADILRHLPPDQ